MNEVSVINTILDRLQERIYSGMFVKDFTYRVELDGGTVEALTCYNLPDYVPIYTSSNDTFNAESFIFIYPLALPEVGNADSFIYDFTIAIKASIQSLGSVVSTRSLLMMQKAIRELIQLEPRTKVGDIITVRLQNSAQLSEVFAGREFVSVTMDYLVRFQG